MIRKAAQLRRMARWLSQPAVFICMMALAIAPLLYASRYNHPSNDDYYNAVWTDFLSFQRQLYLGLTGRYFSSLIVSATPLHWHSLTGYRVAAGILIVGFAGLLYAVIYKLASVIAVLSKISRSLIAAGGVVIFFNDCASLEQGFYWYTGAMTYTLAAMMLMAFLLLCLHLHRQAPLGMYHFPLPALLLICIIGSNEIIIPLTLMICCSLAFYYQRSGRQAMFRFYILLLCVCLPAAVIALMAPGNFIRQAQTPRSLFIALPSWAIFTKDMVVGWLAEPVFQLYSLLVLFAARSLQIRLKMHLVAAFLLPLAAVFLMTLPGFWALGRMPPYRAQNIAYVFFLLGWILFLLQLAERLKPLWVSRHPVVRSIGQLLSVAIIIWMLSGFTIDTLRRSSNYFLLTKNLAKGELRRYDAELEQRYGRIRSASGDTVILAPIQSRHHNTLYFADINPDPKGFPNPQFARYWGKRIIWLDTTGLHHP